MLNGAGIRATALTGVIFNTSFYINYRPAELINEVDGTLFVKSIDF